MAASGEVTTTKPPPPASSTSAAMTTTTTPPKPKGNTTAAAAATPPPLKIITKPGASIYSKPLMLTTYDKYVLGFSMTYLWRCPSSTILAPLFRQNFKPEKHLDIGVGTGFFVGDALAQVLATSTHESSKKMVDITLMDLNEVALASAKARVLSVAEQARSNGNDNTSGKAENMDVDVKITTIIADVLDETFPLEVQPARHQFKSVSMFNLLHCLPSVPSSHDGSGDNGQEIKNRAFKLAAECLADDGTLAGCTVLGRKYIANAYFARPGPAGHGSLLLLPLGASSSGSGHVEAGTQRAESGWQQQQRAEPGANDGGEGKKMGAEINAVVGGATTSAARTKNPSAFSKGMTWAVMKWYNHMGTFGNWTDEREVFERGLRANFEVVETHVVGCMLLFSAARPKRSA